MNKFGKYQHKDYLGTIMQFGLVRERMGDILVSRNGAYIIILAENAQYIKDCLRLTTKFKKSKIDMIDIHEIQVQMPEFEEFKISVNSLRLDNFVSEIGKISRSETAKLIESEQVSINGKIETRISKQIEKDDVLIIRRHGKFIVKLLGTINKKGKQSVMIKKYK